MAEGYYTVIAMILAITPPPFVAFIVPKFRNISEASGQLCRLTV